MEKEKNNTDPITGVFIFAKDIKNDGQIISEGKRPITNIQTNNYSGKGTLKSIQTKLTRDKWYQTWWGMIITGLFVMVVGGLILYSLHK